MAAGKIVPLKRRFHFTFSFFLLMLIILYIAVIGWKYLTKEHISIYEVNSAEISDDSPMYGFVMRSEEVITAENDGYINYYNAEGTRVGAGTVAYTIDENGEMAEILENLQSDKETDNNITAVRDAINSFQNSFSMSDYTQLSAFTSTITGILFDRNEDNLFDSLVSQLDKGAANENYVKGLTKKSGIISYTTDGYETIREKDITADLFEQYAGISKNQLQKNKTISAGSQVYRLVTSNEWSIFVLLDDSYYAQMQNLDYVRVTIDKDNMSFNASVKLFEKDGSHFAKLTTNRYMEHYLNDRFLKIEFELRTASGLKIPNSSILEKDCFVLPPEVITSDNGKKGVMQETVDESGETVVSFVALENMVYLNGSYYVSSNRIQGGDILQNMETEELYIVGTKEHLSGVYCVNQGYCEFCPIETVYQNREYTIVSETTSGGLSAYDHIVVDPANLQDDDFIER